MELPFLPSFEQLKRGFEQTIESVKFTPPPPPTGYKRAVETFIKKAPEIAETITSPVSKFGTPLLKRAGIPSAIATGLGIAGDILLVPGGVEKKAAEEIPAIEGTIKKLIGVIKEAKPVRKEAEALMSAERAKRAAIGAKMIERPGEKGFFAAKGALKGEIPKPQFEPSREKFTQQELDSLFDHVKKQEIPFYEKVNTMTGLDKILSGGKIPTESELRLLKNSFGEEFTNELLKKRPLGEKIKEEIMSALNLPRALMASMDMSAPLRQGLVLSIHKPKQATNAFANMVRYFFDKKYFNEAMKEIQTRPTSQLMRDSGLSITDTTGAISLLEKEEAFMTRLSSKIPLVGASERAYVGFLNKLRADVFDDMAKTYIDSGVSPNSRPEVFKGLADFINTTSGRGALPPKIQRLGATLSTIFFSPRLIASRLQMLNPQWYLKQSPEIRKEAAKAFVKFVSTGIGVLTLANLGGAEVEIDPRSSDFGKIKIGNTRFDIWGGFQQYIRVAAQLITGQTKSTSTGEVRALSSKQFPFTTRKDQLQRFIEGKFAPVPSFVNEMLRQQQLYGEPVDIPNEIYSKMVPLVIQDIVDATKDSGFSMGIAAGIPGFFGVGVQTFQDKPRLAPVLPQLPQLPQLPRLPSLPGLP